MTNPHKKQKTTNEPETPKLNKAEPIAKVKVPDADVKEDDIIDVIIRTGWTQERVLKAVNKSSQLRRLAKLDLSELIEVKESVNTSFSNYKLLGYLVASRGTRQGVRCTTCRNGNGPFRNQSCRSLQLGGEHIAKGACGADIWSSQGSKCDHSESFSKRYFGNQPAHKETARRMEGYNANPNIDVDELVGDAANEGAVPPVGYKDRQGLFVPSWWTKETLLNRLWTIFCDIRIESNGGSLDAPSWLNLDGTGFMDWAVSEDLVEFDEDVDGSLPGDPTSVLKKEEEQE